MQFKQRPLTLVCYICGREFGTKSLEIHLRSCRQKFISEQSRKEKKDRIDLPAEPQLLQALLGGDLTHLEDYNQVATQTHKYQVLPSCRFCARTFNEDSIKVHENACLKKTGFNPPAKDSYPKDPKDEIIKKPRTLVCCVCGRQFGLTSLKIHYPQCLSKFKKEQKTNPKEERREIARFSKEELELINNKLDWTLEQIQSFNKKASGDFREKGMVFCQNCKRTFNPQPFKKHLKNCELINGKNVPAAGTHTSSSKIEQKSQIKKPRVLMCHICGRQFGLMSLQIHQKSCINKFINNEQKKPAAQRKPLPQLPEKVTELFDFGTVEGWDVDKIEEYNKIAGEAYRTESMYQCQFCHRKFIEQSFEKHRSYCERQHQKKIENNLIEQHQKQLSSRNQSNTHEKKQQDVHLSVSGLKQPAFEEASQTKIEKKDCFTIKELAEDLQQTKQQEQQQPKLQKQSPVASELMSLCDNITFKPNPNECLIPSNMHRDALQEHNPKTKAEDIQQSGLVQPHSNIQSDSNSIVKDVMEVSSFSEKQPEDKSSDKFAGKLAQHYKDSETPTLNQLRRQKQEQKSVSAKEVSKPSQMKNQTISENQKGLVEEQQVELGQCQKCGRKFVIERLDRHENICKGNRKDFQSRKNFQRLATKQMRNTPQEPSSGQRNHQIFKQEQKMGQNEDEVGPIGHSKMLVPCKRCGRRFLENRVEVHEQHCKGKQIKQVNKAQQGQNTQMQNRFPIETAKSKNNKELGKNLARSQKQNVAEPQLDKELIRGYDQYQQIPAKELQPCSKCSRKFKLDRIQVHQNACKGPPQKNINFQKELKQAEQSRKNDAVRKTRQNFFQMAKDIKNLKKNEEEIDRELSAQLQTLQKEPQSGRASQNRRTDLLSKEKSQVAKRGSQAPSGKRVQDASSGLENIAKWKRRTINPSPKASLSKQGRLGSGLPQL